MTSRNRHLLAVFAAVVLAGATVLLPTPAVGATTVTESGDAPALPPGQAIGNVVSIDGAFGAAGDVDMYAFCSAGPFSAEVTVFPANSDGKHDSELFLFYANGVFITQNDDIDYWGGNYMSRIVHTMPTTVDRYLLAVGAFNITPNNSPITSWDSSGTATGAYTIALTGVVSCEAVPGAPTMGTPTAGDASVALNWTAPASDGGSAITGYNVYKGTTAGGESATPVNPDPLDPSTTSVTVTLLINGTTYYFTVAAINGAGEGVASNEVSATPIAAPSAPTGVTATTASRTTVTLTWADHGSGITNHRVEVFTYKKGNKKRSAVYTPVTTIDTASAASTYTVPNLSTSSTYVFKVDAVNASGEGAWSSYSNAVRG